MASKSAIERAVRLRQIVGMMPGLLTRTDDEVAAWIGRCSSLLRHIHTAIEEYAGHACPSCLGPVPDPLSGPRTPPTMRIFITVEPSRRAPGVHGYEGAQLAEAKVLIVSIGCASGTAKAGHIGFRMGSSEDDTRNGWQYIQPMNDVLRDFNLLMEHICTRTGLSMHLPFFGR